LSQNWNSVQKRVFLIYVCKLMLQYLFPVSVLQLENEVTEETTISDIHYSKLQYDEENMKTWSLGKNIFLPGILVSSEACNKMHLKK
jgi:hypothetical protein